MNMDRRMPETTNPICIALDLTDPARAADLLGRVRPYIGWAKIGMELFYFSGAAGYELIARQGVPIFLDLKLHDIPNTVAASLRSLMRLAPAPAIVNVHAAGGLDMMKAAAEAVDGRATLIGVTVLTSLSRGDLDAIGFDRGKDIALALAKLAMSAGLHGVVCSPADVPAIKAQAPKGFLAVVPGIRPAEALKDDQKRIATPRTALEAGADILVIGRAITNAPDPERAARDIAASIESVHAG
jgi:orotidine-5'-phosphate decarboxylase